MGNMKIFYGYACVALLLSKIICSNIPDDETFDKVIIGFEIASVQFLDALNKIDCTKDYVLCILSHLILKIRSYALKENLRLPSDISTAQSSHSQKKIIDGNLLYIVNW